jgi:hypothetical protein
MLSNKIGVFDILRFYFLIMLDLRVLDRKWWLGDWWLESGNIGDFQGCASIVLEV